MRLWVHGRRPGTDRLPAPVRPLRCGIAAFQERAARDDEGAAKLPRRTDREAQQAAGARHANHSRVDTAVPDAPPHVYDRDTVVRNRNWRSYLPEGVRPYIEPAPLAALFLGVSSGAPFAMIGATLTTRLAQYGIRKSAVTMFALTFLAYNFKFLWAPLVDTTRIPVLSRFGQRRSWL